MREINPTPTYQEAMRLIRLRRRAKRQGLKLTRSRWHQPYIRNRGGFALLNSQNEIIAGDDYSLDLDAAENLLSTMINHGAIALPQQTRKSGHAVSRRPKLEAPSFNAYRGVGRRVLLVVCRARRLLPRIDRGASDYREGRKSADHPNLRTSVFAAAVLVSGQAGNQPGGLPAFDPCRSYGRSPTQPESSHLRATLRVV